MNSFFSSWKNHWKVYKMQTSKLCFLDMEIMSIRNGVASVNNLSCGLGIYQITTIPLWHNFHIKKA